MTSSITNSNSILNPYGSNNLTAEKDVNAWFEICFDYSLIRKKILNNELKNLTEEDKRLVVFFIIRNDYLHHAIMKGDETFAEALILAGGDVKALDIEGKSAFYRAVQSSRDSEFVKMMLSQGAEIREEEAADIFKKIFTNFLSKKINFSLLLEVITIAPLKAFNSLDFNQYNDLLILCKKNPDLGTILLKRTKELIVEDVEFALKIIGKLLCGHYKNTRLKELFLLVETGRLEDSFLLKILTSGNLFYQVIGDENFLSLVETRWQAKQIFQEIFCKIKDFRLALSVYGLLHASSLDEVIKFIEEDFFHLSESTIKNEVSSHIQKLQLLEGTTIWHLAAEKLQHKKDIFEKMRQLGFDPNWEDVEKRNYFFTSAIALDEFFQTLSCDPNAKDCFSDNAIEHHCRHTKNIRCIKRLSYLGLKIGNQFSYAHKCQNVFPDHPFFQAVLSSALLIPEADANALCSFFQKNKDVDDEEKEEFFAANFPLEDPDFINFKLYFEKNKKRTREENVYFSEKDRSHISQFIKTDKLLEFFPGVWEGEIPSKALTLISNDPIASFCAASIQKRHEKILNGDLPRTGHLFSTYILNRENLIKLNQYLFENPLYMGYLVHDCMTLQLVDIRTDGMTISEYGDFVDFFMHPIKILYHIPQRHQEKIFDAFHRSIPPIVQDTLTISNGAEIKKCGRTALIVGFGYYDAYKFLRKGEKYDYFSQEYSVTQAFAELETSFSSSFHKPMGLYVVRKLPSVLQEFSSEEGAIVYHYKAKGETFEYLQDLPEEKFNKARKIFLHDSAQMVRMGIYPDLAALFHNSEQKRSYALLIDLLVKLQPSKTFIPQGGAGRLDQVFSKLQYPNIRSSGLTDLRDAKYLWGNDRSTGLEEGIKDLKDFKKTDENLYVLQMCGLCNILLIDMLLLAKRYQTEGKLHWKEEREMETFGEVLMEAFALVSSVYAKKDYDQFLKFSRLCGIDWVLAARQIAFWIDTSSEGYPDWVNRGVIPPDIYQEGTRVFVNVSKAKNFDPIHGFSTQGNQDIGIYNGPLGLTEFEKAMYLLFHPILLAEPLGNVYK